MVLDSNCQRDFCGNPLPSLYATWPTPRSDGVTLLLIVCLLDIIFMRFRRLYSLVHFWTSIFLIKIFMVPSQLSCRICDQGRFGGRLFRLSLLTVCCLARRDLPSCCFFLPETHVNGFRATYSGISGLSEAFLRRRLIFFSRFQGLGSLFSDAQHVYTKTTLTLTFVKLVVGECRAPLKSLVCHARLWTIHGYLDVS